jgi:hypothetical protein
VFEGLGTGWIFDTYEAERQPINDQVSYLVMDHAIAMMAQRGGVPLMIEMIRASEKVTALHYHSGDRARQREASRAFDRSWRHT